MKNKSIISSFAALALCVLCGLLFTSGCAGDLGSKAVIDLTGNIVKNGQVIGGSITVVSNTIGAGVNYSNGGTNGGTNAGLSVTVPISSSTNN